MDVDPGTIVKDADTDIFYQFIGTQAQADAITDLNDADFTDNTQWQYTTSTYATNLSTEDYSNASKWEVLTNNLKLTQLSEGEGWTLIDGSGATYVIHKDDNGNLSATQATINVVSAAASIGAGFRRRCSVAVSGAGAFAQNIILSKTQTSIRNSIVTNAHDVRLTSTSSQAISSVVVAASLAIGGGGKAGVGASLGVSISRNLIGYEWDYSSVPADVRAMVIDSSIHASGDLILTALASQTINSAVIAASAAIGAAGKVGVGVSGSGVFSENWIGVHVEASIDGDGANGIQVNHITLKADDTSTISTLAAAVSVAAAFAGNVGVAVSVGVSLSHNIISSSVAAFIANADQVTAAGDIKATADETSVINAVSAAAAVSAAFAQTAVAVSGAGAEAVNIILTKTNAYIQDSTVLDSNNVEVISTNEAKIQAIIVSASLAIAAGSTGVGVSIGVSLAGNIIGWDSILPPGPYYTTGEDRQWLYNGDRVKIESGVRAGTYVRVCG